MKKKVFSKSMAWLLSVVMFFCLFVVTNVNEVDVSAASNESPNYTTGVKSYDELKSRLEALKNKYVGRYWTTNGSAADSSGSTSKSYYGIQCNGFAKYIFNDLFCTGSIGSYDSNKYYFPNANGASLIDKSWNFSSSDTGTVRSILSRSSIGDFVQVRRRGKDYGHSMIISGKDDNGIWIFDCNSDGKCGVKNYYQDWATFASKNVGMSLYHSTKYPSQTPPYADIGTNFVATINEVKANKPLKAVNGNIQIGSSNGNADEKWWFIRQSDGSYIIESIINNNYVTTGGTGNGSNVTTSKYTGSDAQKWYLYSVNGNYELAPKNSTGQRMNVAGGGTGDGTNIITWQAMSGSTDIQFKINKCGTKYIYNLGTDFVATINDVKVGKPFKAASNGNVELTTSKGNTDEKWWFIRQADGTYIIESLYNNNYITTSGTGNGSNVTTSKYTGSDSQKWYVYPSNGKYELAPKNSTGQRMNIAGGGTGDGTNIITWQEMSGSNDTRFSIVNVGSRYIYNLGSEFVANINDVKVGKPLKSVNGNVELGTASGSLNEKWYFTRQADGSYFIQSLSDNNYVTVSGGSNKNGTNIITSKYTGGNEQRWFVYPYNNKFELVPKCAMSFRMNLSGGSTNDKTNIALWQEMYGSNDNLFNISNKAALTSIKFTVSYNMNGGSGSIGNQTKTYGQDLTLSSTKPTRTGYEFVGWNTSASATTAQYSAGGKYTANSGATLYATWKAKQITVTFYRNQNSSDNTTATQTFTYGASGQSFSNKNWTKDGYTLLGWSFDRNATTNSYSITNGVIDDWIDKYAPNAKLYAVWKINTWTVSYNMNGGSGSISNQTKTYGQDLTLSSTKPTRTDYKFVGWNTNKDATTAQYQPGEKYKENKGATLYAIWTINHNYTTKVVAPTCTEKGYTLHTCTNCGNNYKDTYTNALGHDYEETVIAPTETEKGYTLHTCKRCGDSYKDNYTEPVPVHLAGDINGDGKVNMKDATRLHQYINGWKVTVVEEAIDVNGDGKVNMKDVTRLHQYINGWDVKIYVK